MKQINLRDYYPNYKSDVFVEVPDEVALLLREYALMEEAYRIRTYRHKAFYSLEYELELTGGIKSDQPTIEELLESEELTGLVLKGLATLPEKQRRRIIAHYYQGKSKTAIALAEGVDKSRITRSIDAGLRRLEKYLKTYI